MAQNASRDGNFVEAKTAVLNSDGKSVTRLQAGPATHHLHLSDGIGGVDLGPTLAARDENDVPTIMAVSSQDGKTPVVLYCDSNGSLLVQST